jgi:hypothetical protein
MNKGKNFSRNRPRADRMESDFYQTPICLTDEFIKAHVLNNWQEGSQIADLCCGEGAIVQAIHQYPYRIFARDLNMQCDFFDIYVDPALRRYGFEYGIMNPPFRLFNKWVEHCFDVFAISFALLAPTTYLQGVGRYNKDGTGIFQNREYPITHIYTFNRYPMLSAQLRPDGLIETGMQSLSWLVWTNVGENMNGYAGDTIHRWLDIDDYVLRKGRAKK